MSRPILASGTAILVAGLLIAVVYGQPSPPGAVRVPVTVFAYAPQSVKDAYADAGFPFTAQGPYVAFNTRAWYLAGDAGTDAGTLGLPNMPDGLVVLGLKRRTGSCAGDSSCDDGGTFAPAVETVQDCACSTGTKCFIANPDGGLLPDGGPQPFAAPLGVTLGSGTFAGTGCQRKACVEVMGQGLSSWPAACPGGG